MDKGVQRDHKFPEALVQSQSYFNFNWPGAVANCLKYQLQVMHMEECKQLV